MARKHSFDEMLLSRARLGIVSVLISREEARFMDLKALLGLTQGNLTIHLKKLEDGGFVRVKKEFVERKPRTTARITPKGKKAFLKHVQTLQSIADGEDVIGG